MLKLEACTAGYQDSPDVIKNISLAVRPGTFTSVIGPNGCGKSTLLRVLSRALAPTSGSVTLDAKPVSSYSSCGFAKRVAYLPQSRLTPSISVRALVSHGRFPHLSFPRKLSAVDHQIVTESMEKLGVAVFQNRSLTELSGGERQKVYLAMLLAQRSDTLLLDEPTTYLDIHHQLDLLSLLQQLSRDGRAIFMVLHDLSHALLYSDSVLVMRSGALLSSGTPEEVYHSGAISEAFGVRCHKLTDPDTGGVHYALDL